MRLTNIFNLSGTVILPNAKSIIGFGFIVPKAMYNAMENNSQYYTYTSMGVKYIDEEISIGDYVLTGGELPAMVMTDCLARYVDGVISEESLMEESISSGLLEYPQYTRPQEFEGMKVPDVLISGNHAEVDKWRLNESIRITKEKRPDLMAKYTNKNKK